jgi:hypothetical protein
MIRSSRIMVLLSSLLLLTGYNGASQQSSNDRKRLELTGSVKQMTLTAHDFVKQDAGGGVIKQNLVDSISYEFNTDGNLSSQTQHLRDGKPEDRTLYFYDSAGRLVRELRTNNSVEDIDDRMDFVSVFTYNNDNTQRNTYFRLNEYLLTDIDMYDKRSKHLKSQYFDNKGELRTEYTYSYNELGNVVKVGYFNAERKERNEWRSKYDRSGRKVEEVYYKTLGVMDTKWVYRYNDKGDLIQLDQYNAKNERINRVIYSYVYDSHSNWTKKTAYENDKPGLLTERRIDYF